MAHANQKHSNQSPSNAQLKSALSLITAEIARGPLRSSSLSKIMRDAFCGSDASGAWNWRMAYDMMQTAAVQTLFLDASGSDSLGAAKNLAMRLLTETRRSEQQIRLQQFSTPLPYAALAVRAAAIRFGIFCSCIGCTRTSPLLPRLYGSGTTQRKISFDSSYSAVVQRPIRENPPRCRNRCSARANKCCMSNSRSCISPLSPEALWKLR